MATILEKAERNAQCDIHILTRPGLRPSRWLEQCMQSVDLEPCNWWLIDGSSGHMGKLRSEAFQLGSAPYVSFVDDDDELKQGAVEASVAALQSCKCVSQTYTNVERFGGSKGVHRMPYSKVKHLTFANQLWHFHMFRRKHVETLYISLEREANDEAFLLCGLMCKFGQPLHVDQTLYRWRSHIYDHAGAKIDQARPKTIAQITKAVMSAREPCAHGTNTRRKP